MGRECSCARAPAQLGIGQLECKHNKSVCVCTRIAPALQQSVLDGFEQCRRVFLAVGQRTVERAGGAADRLEGMELKQPGALLDGELCNPVQFVHVVEGEREDEAERDARGRD